MEPEPEELLEERRTSSGSTVSLPCSLLHGDSGPTRFVLEWLKDGDVVYTLSKWTHKPDPEGSPALAYRGRASHGPDGSLRLRGVRRSDAGTFFCVLKTFDRPAENPHSPRIRLTVQTLPHFVDGLGTTESLWRAPGATLSAECRADGVPAPDISWTKDGSALPSRAQLSDGGRRLLMERLAVGDEGDWACTASNDVGSVARTFRLAFPKAAWLDVTPANRTAIEGASLLWECHAQGEPAEAALDVAWLAGETRIPFANLALRAQTIGSNLRISPVRREDRGWYRCSASNGHGDPASAAAFLDVHYPAEVSRLTAAIQHLPLGLGAFVDCRIEANPPASFVNWAKGGRVLDTRDPQGQTFTSNNGARLHFRHVVKEDAGIYSCQAYNQVGGSNPFEVHVLVQEPPYFVVTPVPRTVRRPGDSIRLDCAGGGRPDPQIFWKRADNAALPRRARQRSVDGTTRLEIDGLTAADHGTYECVVQNLVTAITREARLTIMDTPPQAPGNVTVLSGAFDAKLSWAPGFDGGHPPQLFTLKYREAGALSWTRQEVGESSTATLAFLHPDVLYEYQILPRNAKGEGFPSPSVQTRTLGYGGIGAVLPTDATGTAYYPALSRPIGPRPGTPRGLQLVSLDKGGVELAWEAPPSSPVPIFFYAVEYRPNLRPPSAEGSEGYRPLRSRLKNTRLGLGGFGELLEGRTFDLRVRAHSLAAASLPSKPIAYTVDGGVGVSTALMAGVVGGVAFAVLALALLCCAIARRCAANDKAKGKEPYENGKAVYDCGDGGFGEAAHLSPYSPPAKLTVRDGTANVRCKRVPSLVPAFLRQNQPLPQKPAQPSIHLSGPLVPQYRSQGLEDTGVYSVGRARLSSLRDLLSHVAEDAPPPELEIRPLGHSACLLRRSTRLSSRPSNLGWARAEPCEAGGQEPFERDILRTSEHPGLTSGGYSRERLLTTIGRLRESHHPPAIPEGSESSESGLGATASSPSSSGEDRGGLNAALAEQRRGRAAEERRLELLRAEFRLAREKGAEEEEAGLRRTVLDSGVL